MKGICLCSGGLDSTLALLKLLKEEHEVVPMFVDYNQWPLEDEIRAFHKVGTWVRSKLSGKFNYDSSPGIVKTYGKLLKPVLVKVNLDTFPEGGRKVGSVWGRSIALVGLAAMWAYTHGNDYDFIALGNHKGDVGPDCKPGRFDSSLHDALIEGTKGQLDLVLPIRSLTIEDIGKELAKFGIPWNLMYSCYWSPPCGYKSKNEGYRCPGCRRKAIAMKSVGVTDEKLLNFPNGEERAYQSESAEKVGY